MGYTGKALLSDVVLLASFGINIHGLTLSNRPKRSLRVLIKSR
jgi:hypothetical protein